jgi:hypothetical protein
MAPDPRTGLVEAFVVGFRRSLADGGRVEGEPGVRVALLVDQLAQMHRPDVTGRCRDCRAPVNGGSCQTWTALANVLVGWEPSRVEQEYRRLAARNPAGPPLPGSAGSARRLRLNVMVFLGAERLPVRLARDQVVLAVPQGDPPGVPLLLTVASGVVGVGVGGRRYAVHGPGRATLADPAEAWPVLLDDAQVIHTTDDLRGWPLLLIPPVGTAEVTLYDTDRNEIPVGLDPSSRGRPVG